MSATEHSVVGRLFEGIEEGLLESAGARERLLGVRLDTEITVGVRDAEHRRAMTLADRACRAWLSEMLLACNEDETVAAAREHAEQITDSARAEAAAHGARMALALLKTEPAKLATGHAAQAARAVAHDADMCSADLDQTAALNAGRVLAELWLFDSEEDALRHLSLALQDLAAA